MQFYFSNIINYFIVKARGLYKLLNRIEYGLKYKGELVSNTMFWKYILTDKIKVECYSLVELKSDIDRFNNLGNIDIWSKDFYGLDVSESISAIAVPTGQKLRNVRRLIKESGL